MPDNENQFENEFRKAMEEAGAAQHLPTKMLEDMMKTHVGIVLRVAGESGNINIVRKGDKIILPEGMTTHAAVAWLIQTDIAENSVIKIDHTIPCMPLDGVNAMWKCIQTTFGHVEFLRTEGSMFTPSEPPTMLSIPTGIAGKFEQVPFCRMRIPALDGGWLMATTPIGFSGIKLIGEVKKKHEHRVKELLASVADFLKTHSIYRGKALSLDLGFLNTTLQDPRRFDLMKHAPEFLNVDNATLDNIILNEETAFDLGVSVFLRIESPQACIDNNMPLKHGAVFSGTFGTGKTSAGYLIANLAQRHGWTFIYCKDNERIVEALQIAKQVGNTVVFFEDVDAVLSGERDEEMNAVFEAMDGIDAKNNNIISIFTTNNVSAIHPGFMRAGRVETLLRFHKPDAPAARKFVSKFARTKDGDTVLAGDIDMEAVGEAVKGLAPAELFEIVGLAKASALRRNGGSHNITGKVKTADILAAARSKQARIALTEERPPLSKARAVIDALSLIEAAKDPDFDPELPHHWAGSTGKSN